MEVYQNFVRVAFSDLLKNVCDNVNDGIMDASEALKLVADQVKNIGLKQLYEEE